MPFSYAGDCCQGLHKESAGPPLAPPPWRLKYDVAANRGNHRILALPKNVRVIQLTLHVFGYDLGVLEPSVKARFLVITHGTQAIGCDTIYRPSLLLKR